MTDKETAICKRFSKRDKNGKVHCFKCPLVIDKKACVCKKVLEDSRTIDYDTFVHNFIAEQLK